MATIITIEGNIGSGKSTFLDYVRRRVDGREDVVILDEPVAEWEAIKDADGRSMLELFYGDTARYGFPFQMLAFISRLALINDALDEARQKKERPIIICERSLACDRNVFAQMLKDDNKISDVEFNIYLKWYEHFTRKLPPSNIVYLRCHPEVADKRITKRARVGEAVSMAYLHACHAYHERWIGRTGATVLDSSVQKTDCVYAAWYNDSIQKILDASDSISKS